MEKCLNCGRDIDSGLSICPYCGNLMRTVEIDPSENEKSVSNDGGEEKNQQNTDSAPQLDQDLDEFKKTDGEFLFQSEQDILQSQLSQPTQTSQPPDYPVEEIKTSNKKKKIVFLVGGIVIAFVVLLAVILLFGRAQKEGGTEGSRKVYTDIEGDAYCFNKKNKLIKIEGEWNGGYITGDGKHIVLTDKDKKLYCFDGKGNNGVQVRSEGGTLITIQNNGFIYTVDTNSDEKDSDTAYRYDFDTEEKTQIGSGIICPAYNSLDVLVYKDQGIYILPEKASELVKVASCEKGNLVQPIGISDNGKMAVWTEKIGSKVSIYVAENNEKVKVSDVELSDKGYDDIFAYFINDGTEVIIGDGTNEQILRKKIGEDCIATKIAGGIFLFDIYSAQGAIYEDHRDKVKGLYVIGDSEEKYLSNLYYIDERGEREKIITKIQKIVSIHNGRVVYLDEEGSLFIADLGTKELKNIQKISSDVYVALVSKNGEYIYYGKDSDYETFTLYECKAGKEMDSNKISDDVYKMWISEDGKQIAYFKDPTNISETYTEYGELYVKNFGKDPKKVGSDMISIFGVEGYFLNDNWNCFKYEEMEKENIIGKILHFNGKDVEVEATDIIYDVYTFEDWGNLL